MHTHRSILGERRGKSLMLHGQQRFRCHATFNSCAARDKGRDASAAALEKTHPLQRSLADNRQLYFPFTFVLVTSFNLKMVNVVQQLHSRQTSNRQQSTTQVSESLVSLVCFFNSSSSLFLFCFFTSCLQSAAFQ